MLQCVLNIRKPLFTSLEWSWGYEYCKNIKNALLQEAWEFGLPVTLWIRTAMPASGTGPGVRSSKKI